MLRSRFPKDVRRLLPIYCGIVLLILFFAKAHSYSSSPVDGEDVLKRVLSGYQTPLQMPTSIIPRKIWQTWKIQPLDFDIRDSERARSWTSMNPGHRYEVLTDNNDLHYVETHFGPGPGGINRPDIVNMYRSLNATIIKADLLRYLILYIEGGIYADIDVEALKPIDQFLPSQIKEKDVGLVISVEIDEPTYWNHTILGPKSQSFCQWTFMSKPRVPVLLKLVDHILVWLDSVAKKQDVPIGEIVLNFDEVITGTGPSAFTNIILAEMSKKTGKKVTWESFHALQEAKLVGGILVLPVVTFAAGQGHSNSGNHENPQALVKHHYHASLWPSRHPRYSHPAYGMVEECNWNSDCVRDWDKNTAAYPSLPEDQQNVLIEAHNKMLREKFAKEVEQKVADDKGAADKKQEGILSACAEQIRLLTAKPQEKPQEQSPTQEQAASQTQTPSQEQPPSQEQVSHEQEQTQDQSKPQDQTQTQDQPQTQEQPPKEVSPEPKPGWEVVLGAN